jgi:hypothetical protein
MDTEVELAERERRLILLVASPGSGPIDGVSSSTVPGGGAAGTGRFPADVSLGGVWRYPGVAETDDPGEGAFGERLPSTPRRF